MTSVTSMNQHFKKTRHIVASMDTGIDDALALAYVLAPNNAHATHLIGVSATYGNVSAPDALRNTRDVLQLLGSDTPVVAGAQKPSWAHAFLPDAGCAMFHGSNGLGGCNPLDYCDANNHHDCAHTASPAQGEFSLTLHEDAYSSNIHAPLISVGGYPLDDAHAMVPSSYAALEFESSNSCAPSDGARMIIDAVRKFGTDVTVLATGPLTDITDALRHAPDIAEHMRLVFMGGALCVEGNCWDLAAETNIIQDPEAADYVMHSDADITMIGLDVTHQCLLGSDSTQQWRASHNKALTFLADIADFSIHANITSDPVLFAHGMPLHDPLAAAVALHPEFVRTIDIPMKVETRTGDGFGVRGRTVCDQARYNQDPVHVALQVNSSSFVQDFTDSIAQGEF